MSPTTRVNGFTFAMVARNKIRCKALLSLEINSARLSQIFLDTVFFYVPAFTQIISAYS
jgi:hypothetical protein